MRLLILLVLISQFIQSKPLGNNFNQIINEKNIISTSKAIGSLLLFGGLGIALWGMNERRTGIFGQRMQNSNKSQQNEDNNTCSANDTECKQKIELGQKQTDYGVIIATFGLLFLGIREVYITKN